MNSNVVLAAFERTASHLFNIQFGVKRYEIMFEEDEPANDPIRTKLATLKLSVGYKLSME